MTAALAMDGAEDELGDTDLNPLTQYDAERLRVRQVVSAAVAADAGADVDADGTHAVATELLMDDLDASIPLPKRWAEPRLPARVIWERPRSLVACVVALAAVAALWVAADAGDKFSVDPDLFSPANDPALQDYLRISSLDNEDICADAACQLKRHDDSVAGAGGRRAAEEPMCGPNGNIPPTDASEGEAITLVYVRRALVAEDGDVLQPLQLKAIHDFEAALLLWAEEQGVCAYDASCRCAPIDSFVNFLYPTLHTPAAGHNASLTFDARMDVTGGGCFPPFSATDLRQAGDWLVSRGVDGFFSHDGAWPPPSSPPTAANATGSGAGVGVGIGNGGSGGDGYSTPLSQRSVYYLRSTARFSRRRMDSWQWTKLAKILDHANSGLQVRIYYGGGEDLMFGELMASLQHDLWLLLLAIALVGALMRLYFGSWRMTLLAALQLALAFPIMYFVVIVMCGQGSLSAFAAASLWVVVGVSADNIFVMHETWKQANMLVDSDGHPVDGAARVQWTVIQAAVPLFFADVTTAFSLLINCASSITSVFQFGLCGGVLIMVNFVLALTYLPALLVLEERLGLAENPTAEAAAVKSRAPILQAAHSWLWDNRMRVLTAFGIAALVLAPLAVTLAPGFDASFTFAADPDNEAVIARARAPPPWGLFPSVEGERTYEAGAAVEATAAVAHIGHADAAQPLPSRYAGLLDGTYTPPPPPPLDATVFGVLLSVIWLMDAALLYVWRRAAVLGTQQLFFDPPDGGGTLPAVSTAAHSLLAIALCIGTFTLAICGFAADQRTLLGDLLALTLLAHSGFFFALARVSRSGEQLGPLVPSDWMHSAPDAAATAFAAASAASLAGSIIVFFMVHSFSYPPGWIPTIHFGLSFHGAAGLCLLLSLMLQYDAAVAAAATMAAYHNQPIGPLRPAPALYTLLSTTAGTLQGIAVVLLLVAATPAVRLTMFGASHTILADIVAIVAVINAAGHAVLCRVFHTQRPLAILTPTLFSREQPGWAVGLAAAATAGFAAVAAWAFALARNPTACDADADGLLSLQEVTGCVPLLSLWTMLGSLWHWLPLSADFWLAPASSSVLGVCLGGVWLVDAAAAATAAAVAHTSTPRLCLSPLPDNDANMRLLPQLASTAAALAPLGMLTLLLVTFAPAAFDTLAGPEDFILRELLGLSLLANAPPLALLSAVFGTRSRMHMLTPTRWAEESKAPAAIAGLAAVLCLVCGCILVYLGFWLPPAIPLPEWGVQYLDRYGILLFALLTLDSIAALAAARVQATGRPTALLRPMDAPAGDSSALAIRFGSVGGGLGAVAAVVLLVSLDTRTAAVVFHSARAMPILLGLALSGHAVGLAVVGYAMRHTVAIWMLQPPPLAHRSTSPAQLAYGLGGVCAALSLVLPLADGGHLLESIANAAFAVLLLGIIATHSMYEGSVAFVYGRNGPNPPAARWTAFALTTAAAAAVAGCLTLSIPAGAVVLPFHTFLPVQYLLLCFLTAFAFINWLPLVAAMETWYTSGGCGGFAIEDAPHGPRRLPSALVLLLLSLLSFSCGTALLTTTLHVVQLDSASLSWHGSLAGEISAHNAERCFVAWGDAPAWHTSGAGTPPHPPLRLGRPAAQLEMLYACDALHSAASPAHSTERYVDADADAGVGVGVGVVGGRSPCLMRGLRAWVLARNVSFPLAEERFAEALVGFLRQAPHFSSHVGFDDDTLQRVAWVREPVHAKFASSGTEALQLLADPNLMAAYKDEWDLWVAQLPQAAREASPPLLLPLPPVSESPLRHGVTGCPKWGLLATEVAFFDGVFTAIVATPLFSMAAIAAFVRSLVVSYAALYALVGMVVSILGLMHLLGVPLGVAEALALSLVVGISVDYIIHIAHAYKHSLFEDRYYKSRAAVFARAGSISASALTTLAAVSPLLLARLLPLRDFGIVFAIVTVVSVVYAVAFLAILMVIGPLRTRGGDDGAGFRQPWPASAPAITGRHGAGWALHVDVGEAHGVHGADVPYAPDDKSAFKPPQLHAPEDDAEML